jgi:Protein of unknown function (DUF1592)/Protein of unknown function (DUF1588)/Protein of unknown function (DUF1595)/Protein of unknown function (DUF1587)
MENHPGFLLSVRFCAIGALLTCAACTAMISSGDHSPGASSNSSTGSGSNGSSASGSTVTDACDANASVAPARVWRLTDGEYVSVVQSVFGVTMPPAITAAQVDTADYTNISEGTSVSLPIAQAYQTAAQQAAEQAVASHLSTFLPCGVQAPTDACVEQFIRNRVSRAFGRPVTDDEVQDLLAVYKTSGVDGPAVGIQLVIEAALQSASFLYRTELGPLQDGGPTAKVTLTPYEIATAMSFALRDSAPDDVLWKTAEDGSLATPKVLAAQVDRMLALPAVQANLSHKAGYWLGVEKLLSVEKSATAYPEFTAQVQNDLYTSGELFVQNLIANGSVKDLLSSRRMYLNESLAKIYGVSGVTSTDLVPVDVQLDERASGIMSQPAVLAASDAHPDSGDVVHRGLFIYYALVCGSAVGSPPANATALDAALPANSTDRQRSTFRTTTPECTVCHSLFDPFGLATERYDPIGRYQATDASGAPIDSSAVISTILGPDLAGPISGLPDVATRLQAGQRVSNCAVSNLGMVALGRDLSQDQSCAIKTVKDKFAASGTFSDFYRELLTSPGFVTRDAAPAAH